MSPAQTSYSYSPTNELTQSGTSAFSYDRAGNIVSMPGTTLSYNLGDELTSTTQGNSTTSFAYDPNGNRISESSSTSSAVTYGYNANNQLTSILSPTLSASYSYNPAGLRSSATYNGVTSSFVYSPSNQLLTDGENYYIYGPSGVPIEQVSQSTGAATYLFSDQLGSVVMEADQNGNVVATQSYSPYGTLASSTGTDPTPFGFAGGYTDPTGLIYLINRYYDPVTGQFVSVDPAISQTEQTYEYAIDNPANFLDPTGLFPVSEAGISCKPKGTVIKCTAATRHIWSSAALAIRPGTPPGLEAAGANLQINEQKYVITRSFPNPCLNDHGTVELNDTFIEMQKIVQEAKDPPHEPWSSVGPLIVTYDEESVTVNIYQPGEFDFEPIIIDPDVLG